MGLSYLKRKLFSTASSASGSGDVLKFSTTLTAAQVKTISSSPITLIAAQGANKIIYVDPFSIMFKLSAGTAFNFGAGDVTLGIGNMSVSFPLTDINGNAFLNPSFVYDTALSAGAIVYSDTSANTALTLSGGSDAAAGTRTLKITFLYSILDIS